MTQARAVTWLGIGSNLDNPAQHVRQALQDLIADADTQLLAASRLYRTTPVGGPAGQPDFCNACAAVASRLAPWALLRRLQCIETAHGRVRDVRWGPRTLDLDMLAHDALRMRHKQLQLPHPRAAERAFVLVPLAELAPTLVLDGRRVIDHLRAVDTVGVRPWDSEPT